MRDILPTLWRMGDYCGWWLMNEGPNLGCAGEEYEQLDPWLGRSFIGSQSNANRYRCGSGADELIDGLLNDDRRAKK